MITQILVLQVHSSLHKQELKINECVKAAGSGSTSFNMHVKYTETVPKKVLQLKLKVQNHFFPAAICAFLDDSLQLKLLYFSLLLLHLSALIIQGKVGMKYLSHTDTRASQGSVAKRQLEFLHVAARGNHSGRSSQGQCVVPWAQEAS